MSSDPQHEQTRSARILRRRARPAKAGDGTASRKKSVSDSALFYVACFTLLTFIGAGVVWRANQTFAPEMYDASGPVAFAKAFEKGENFATFDLNINIRDMREQQIARMKEAPGVVVLGASHWQEAHTELLPNRGYYNSHVHRDYYEDMLAVVEMYVRHKKMPKRMIIAIRDRLFTPVLERTDFLWLPGIPYYERMARRLGIEPHPYWKTAPAQRWREQLSLSMLFTNVSRWYKAPVKPHATSVDHHRTLDTLRPGGSIYWSAEHQDLFTRERSDRLAREFADQNYPTPPSIDPIGLATLDKLFAFLKKQGVEVFLVHPPFNPIYYERVQGSPYMKGLQKIEDITVNFAKKYDFKVFGSFNPADIGCTAEMYIDAEHSNPECLGKVFEQYMDLTRNRAGREPTSPDAIKLPVRNPFLSKFHCYGQGVSTADLQPAFRTGRKVLPRAAKAARKRLGGEL